MHGSSVLLCRARGVPAPPGRLLLDASDSCRALADAAAFELAEPAFELGPSRIVDRLLVEGHLAGKRRRLSPRAQDRAAVLGQYEPRVVGVAAAAHESVKRALALDELVVVAQRRRR